MQSLKDWQTLPDVIVEAASALTGTQSTLPTFMGGGSGKIGYTSIRDENPDIYMLDFDSSEETRLTEDAAIDNHVTFTPDGPKIAFATKRDGNYEVYLMNADGTEKANLSNHPAGDFPYSISPG